MELLRNWSLKFFDNQLEKGYDWKVRNSENLEILNIKPYCPAVFIFNHSASDDPILAYKLIYPVAPERVDNVIVPVSEHHTKLTKFPLYSVGVTLSRGLLGFDTPKVVQPYRLRKDVTQNDELSKKSAGLARELFGLLDEKLPTAPLVLLSPEAHRSESGQLLPGEAGAGAIAKLMEKKKVRGEMGDGFFIPIGIEIENYTGKKLYYNTKDKSQVTFTVGRPITSAEAVAFGRIVSNGEKAESIVISHYLMSQIARLLPEGRQGVYHPDLIADTFKGRFIQRSDKNDNVYVYDIWNQQRFEMAQV
ncbi:hypothetical protein A2962_04335 [Candidatus Woesebacteria bacterium RIFCSPLOWO2_01_FULL_39_61]|uniref:Phospholipid/glycerol acyltransferase domain-containing protein n=1 Tax=Candidatus Woesebacteria bacterium RIFCSPHIGHO2_02_FULL_39_13 TaxID=1802505 RepID=A0A1F7Z825_9BACT|nr:MAG: hypothetical protein A2692_03460 [Candidatus Woesebacteria bacterium RIFCSPHIGHO2_01_FULL_39_95]OGM34905.1 MAG: hypothetical protein A3D01_00315 [Candidatus Woesebacteria bacterium RIFCSPHIGHO2_02_FULL_39_13]OGM37994.1 MAG: hypothetical protein A3E13_05330 [Candidatus Woesebacteria bacterium RIFCSPHIGHO2_12_FULL_40_20]OGM66610.1 MAG: hypothetical protein A2962_04335 [Candidatus Woesebacteria bacterium RIFCSPLOWO2_01_FULL_39_61]OGM71834.1 MAG: hypothetical protein A3H19_01720 [Candidatus